MFTGIVAATGRVRSLAERPDGVRLVVDAGALAAGAGVGDSVAVDGCCLTVVAREGGMLAFDVVPETLRRTTLGARKSGDRVNLELPLRPSDRLGGHFVQGHVDAVADVLERREDGGGVRMRFALPSTLRGQLVEKGSVAVDGVSLTVAAADGGGFEVALIPHTLAVTTLGERRAGDRVNVEGDVLAKYVASLLPSR